VASGEKPASGRAGRKKPGAGGWFTASRPILPWDLYEEAQDALLDLKRTGNGTSWSGLVEVALRELLKRKDLTSVVRRYGIGPRRDRG
jgi:hypothetical protein